MTEATKIKPPLGIVLRFPARYTMKVFVYVCMNKSIYIVIELQEFMPTTREVRNYVIDLLYLY